MPSSTIALGSGNSISFSAIKTAYTNAGGSMPGQISLNALRNAGLDGSNTVPGSGAISVGTVFYFKPTVGATFDAIGGGS